MGNKESKPEGNDNKQQGHQKHISTNNTVSKYKFKDEENKSKDNQQILQSTKEENKNIDKTKIDLNIETKNEKAKSTNNVLSNEELMRRISLKTTGGSLFQDIRQIYKFKEVLGGGHFGTVRIGYKRNEEPRKFYGIKSISKKNLTEKDLEDLMKEVEILSCLDHPNITKFLETYHDQFYFHIIMELCTGREVFDKIIEEGHLTEHKVAQILYKVLSAINYCHSMGITHRDIKPENILFETQDADSEIKLIDFGLSRKYNRNEKMHTILGTPYYVAPEVLKGEYDEKCDVWSIGAIAYIMLCGDPPFNGNSNNEIFNRVINDELKFAKNKWKSVSKEAIDFVMKCMNKNPEERFTAKEAMNHKWFITVSKEIHSSANLNSEILENLKNFSTPQKFKKMVLKFLVNMLSQKEIKDLRNAFYAIDTSHSGHLTTEELKKAFKLANVEVSTEEIDDIIHKAQGKESDKIDYTEFLVASLNQKKFIDKEKLISAFKYFDIDNSGFIDSADLKNALLRSGRKILNVEDIDKMIEEVATANSNNNKISLSEFLNLFGYTA